MNRRGNVKHGRHRKPEYISWQNAKARARRAGHPGIDPRWLKFEPFFMDMGERPIATDLGRKDHDLPYSMENCEWMDSADNRREANFRRWYK